MMELMIYHTMAAFVGTVAFSVLFSVPKKQIWVCGLVGSTGWVIYDLASGFLSDAESAFFAAMIIALLARVLAVVRKVPANVIMLPGIFPIIPGLGIYDMIYDLLIGNTISGLSGGFSVLKVIGAIVLGLVVSFSLPRSWFKGRKKDKPEKQTL